MGLQLGVVALIALTVAMVLATVAGARRTDTAFDRFVDESRLPDLILSVEEGEGDPSAAQLAEMQALPTVAGLGRLQGYALEPSGTDLYQPTAAPSGRRVGSHGGGAQVPRGPGADRTGRGEPQRAPRRAARGGARRSSSRWTATRPPRWRRPSRVTRACSGTRRGRPSTSASWASNAPR